MFKRALCWIRRDLRLNDHAPLAEATSLAKECAVAFVFDDGLLGRLERDNRQVTFMHRSLSELDGRLHERGSKLLVGRGDPVAEVLRLAQTLKADVVVWGKDYEPIAIERDSRVAKELKAVGIEGRPVKDIVALEPGEVLNGDGKPFRVFTPYSRAWREQFENSRDAADHESQLDKLIPSESLPPSADWGFETLGFEQVPLWVKAGEDAARERLKEFLSRIEDYGVSRDFPASEGTSKLSVDLRFGTISVRELFRSALARGGAGAEKWVSELIWREFYQDIVFHFPEVVNEPFQPEYRPLKWPGAEHQWELWRDGMTGYPIIDAAMRCLNRTGYMHNRLRMVTASFLTKDQLIDYREGEAWFARQLLDHELASNNGGWQWAASVGCDPQPYFRIFNPILQSRKFDPKGEFIRRWVPEIGPLSNQAIHAPWEAGALELEEVGVRLGRDYPLPCVDHAEQRKKAIALLETAKKTN